MPGVRANNSAHGRNSRRFKQMAKTLRSERRPCWICGQPIDYEADQFSPNAFEVDHILPRSTHPQLAEDPSNLAASHRRCNGARSNHDAPPSLGSTSRAW